MRITGVTAKTVTITLTRDEARAVRDDLGDILASRISVAGDHLHTKLDIALDHKPGEDRKTQIKRPIKRPA